MREGTFDNPGENVWIAIRLGGVTPWAAMVYVGGERPGIEWSRHNTFREAWAEVQKHRRR